MKNARPSLLWIVSTRIVFFSLVAIALQVAIICAQYWTNNYRLASHLITNEADVLRAGFAVDHGKMSFRLPDELAAHYGFRSVTFGNQDSPPPGYYAKVTDQSGAVLFASCDVACIDKLFPVQGAKLPRWQVLLASEKPLSAVGARAIELDDGVVAEISIAVIKDPDRMVWGALRGELLDHLLFPMLNMLLLVMLATILSIRSALRPTISAAAKIDRMQSPDSFQPIDFAMMPREIAALGNAVNHAFTRLRELMQAQKVFSAAVSHEIRTPIAIARLELENIDDSRAKKAIDELDAITHVVEQLTQLARIENLLGSVFTAVDIAQIASATSARLAPYVYSKSHSIEFSDQGTVAIEAVPSLIEIVISNLIENAVRHTPPETHIVVQAGPGANFSITDVLPVAGARQVAPTSAANGDTSTQPGIGLQIVERIAKLHRAIFSIDSKPGKGTTVTVKFAPFNQAVASSGVAAS